MITLDFSTNFEDRSSRHFFFRLIDKLNNYFDTNNGVVDADTISDIVRNAKKRFMCKTRKEMTKPAGEIYGTYQLSMEDIKNKEFGNAKPVDFDFVHYDLYNSQIGLLKKCKSLNKMIAFAKKYELLELENDLKEHTTMLERIYGAAGNEYHRGKIKVCRLTYRNNDAQREQDEETQEDVDVDDINLESFEEVFKCVDVLTAHFRVKNKKSDKQQLVHFMDNDTLGNIVSNEVTLLNNDNQIEDFITSYKDKEKDRVEEVIETMIKEKKLQRQGARGPPGPKGPKGDKGDKGRKGPKGDKGELTFRKISE